MKELLQKKKNEKRVVKYVLRKYTVGVVSVAISTSLIAPIIAAASPVNSEDGIITSILQEVDEKAGTLDELIDSDNNIIEEVDEKIEDLKTIKESVDNVDLHALPTDEEVNKIINEVRSDLNSIQYEDLYEYLNPSVSGLDRIKVITELRKLGKEPTEEEIQREIKKLYMEKLDLKTSFDNVKNNLEDTLKKLLKNTDRPVAGDIRNCKNQVLLGLMYLDKQYSFSFGGKTAKEIILYGSNFTNARNIYDLIAIGNLSYSDLELKSNINTYNKRIKSYVNGYDIFTFVEKCVENYAPGKTVGEWFKEESKAFIVESNSKSGNTSLYNKMKNDVKLKNHLIPLLAVSENSIYAISTMSTVNYGLVDTYIEDKQNIDKNDFKSKLEETAVKQQAFLDFWYRISKVRNKLIEENNIIIIDSLLDYGTSNKMSELWSAEYGSKALPGVREFISPLGYYSIYLAVDGQAGTDTINLFLSKSLTDRGQATYTHELTHILDNKVWFNGYGRRQGKGAETFARGMFEIVDNMDSTLHYKPMFNLNLTYELQGERVQNASPNRFQNEEDLQKYMQGLMDVLYTLDYAEAQSSLSKTDEEKAILYNQLELTKDSKKEGIVNDTFSNISVDTASKLKTVNDLIDNNIVSGRFAYQGISTIGTVQDNGYYIVPLFEPIYAAMQNNNGAVGDITFKRNAYELLAQYGYSNGMVSYISNQYANDEEALKAILDSKYNGSLAEFKKDMFAIRASRVKYLKSTDHFNDFAELQRKMDEAVQKDLEQMKHNKKYNIFDINSGVTAVSKLKTEILQWYLEETKDFEESIYENVTVGEYIEETEEKIPIVVINKTDDSLWEDESRTVEGTEGVVKITKVWKTENNVPVGTPIVTRETISEGTPTIVYKGTKKIYGEIVTVDDNVKIPVTTIEKEDSNLYIGQTKVVEGKDGIKKVTTTQKTKKNQPVGEAVITEEVVIEMVPTVVYVGTKSLPKQDEVTNPDKDDDSLNDNISKPENKPENKPDNSDETIGSNSSSNGSDNVSGNTNNTVVSGTTSIVTPSTGMPVINNNEKVEELNESESVIEETEVERKNTEEELLVVEENKDLDNSILESEKKEFSLLDLDETEKKKGEKSGNAVPIAIASGIAVVSLAAVVVKSVFDVKLLSILRKIFKFK